MNGGEMVGDVDKFKGADFLLDMEMSVVGEKRLRGQAFCEAENGRVDVSYASFLDEIHTVWDAKLDEEGEEKEVDDPIYLAFLRNLKAHGTAYICGVSLENGVLSPIIYEEESNPAGKIKRRTARMSIGSNVQQKRKLIHDDDLKFVRKDAVAKNDSGGELKRRCVDAVGDRKPHMRNSDSRSGHRDGMKGRKRALTSRMNGVIREYRSLGVDGVDKKSGSKCSDFLKKRPVIDENYGIFIDHLHIEGKHVFSEYRDHNRIYYESTNPQKTNVEVVDVELEPLEAETSDSTSIIEPPMPIPGSPEEAYWRELHHQLRKPYDQEEFDDLLELLSTRKPVFTHRESRSGGSDRPGHMGKSYLDLYPDLNCEIEKVKFDRHKVLNLLRMCKFYVQKIPSLRSGHTRPWMDKLSKTILPGSSDGTSVL